MAGLWSVFKDRRNCKDVANFTILTTEANPGAFTIMISGFTTLLIAYILDIYVSLFKHY